MLGYKTKKTAIIAFIAVFFICIDRFLKQISFFYFKEKEISIVGNLLKFHLSKNYNIAFSLPFLNDYLIIIISFLIIFLVFFFVFLIKKKEIYNGLAVFLIILGASSNLADRINHGFVIDYLDLKYFTVFNLADAMIVGGAFFLVWKSLKKPITKKT